LAFSPPFDFYFGWLTIFIISKGEENTTMLRYGFSNHMRKTHGFLFDFVKQNKK
jgi:hypothetical protein